VKSAVLIVTYLIIHALAIMSDSYERIQDQAALEQQRLRAGLLLELEIHMSKRKKKDKANYPAHLHVLIPKDHDETKFGAGDQWLGVLGAMKGEINEQREKTKKDISAVEESLSKKISAVEESNKTIQLKMDEIISLLKQDAKA
jgi:hypothetical protein